MTNFQEPPTLRNKNQTAISQRRFESYSGTDIKAVMYLPMITRGKVEGIPRAFSQRPFIEFAGLQTISISSTRSISPVRALGKSSPVHFTRGARTFAGTMVFAVIETDPFLPVFDLSMAESLADASTSLFVDQLPPFSVVITAANETGGIGMQVIHGITLVNYGTTYSIDDIYTETIYSYVATDVSILNIENRNALLDAAGSRLDINRSKTITDALVESLVGAYHATESVVGWAVGAVTTNPFSTNNGLSETRPHPKPHTVGGGLAQ